VSAVKIPAAQEIMPGRVMSDLYAFLSPAERYIHQTRDAALLDLLARRGYASLSEARTLEIGCGEGAFLRTLLHYGARPELLTGVDIDAQKLERAAEVAPGATLSSADGASLQIQDATFDLVFAFTFLSSVIEPAPRRRAAAEALRVLRDDGLLVVYDFWTNPFNSRVRAVSAAELRSLFRGARVEIERVTLAPPIVRALGGRPLCRALERVPFLRTHLLAVVTKEHR
jgi:ubiquinone/menaquinone biosynthesis C-methylase UbiE